MIFFLFIQKAYLLLLKFSIHYLLKLTKEYFKIITDHQGGNKRNDAVASDDDSLNDACSITSGQSDARSILEDVNDNNEIDEISQQEAFEEKLKEAIDGLTQKNAKGRICCFQGVEKIFAIKYVPEFAEDRKLTITDSIEKGLKKGRGDEQSSAARLSTLLCVQLGEYESSEIVCKDLKSTLTFIANDNTASIAGRSEVSFKISIFIF